MWLISLSNTRTYKLTHTPTIVQVVGGRGGDETPPLDFRFVRASEMNLR